MTSVEVLAGRPYPVGIARGLIDRVGEGVAESHPGCRAAVVSDDRVFSLYGRRVVSSLEAAGIPSVSFAFPNGEASKTPETWLRVVRFLSEAGLTRRDVVVALGGGVVGDLAGFAAATYLRGVRFYQVPTTLLAMIDSSVGGKTGVDLPAGKNLLGAFWQPDGVFADPDTLDTLPDDVFADGVAEAIKTGILFDKALFLTLKTGDFRSKIEQIVAFCVQKKAEIVEKDEREAGPRRLLNLGHTLGHAVEKLSGYTFRHGQAVAAGTCMIARAAVRRGLLADACAREIESAFRENGLPVDADYSPQEIAAAAGSDKKRAGDRIALVVPREIGRCEIVEVPVSELPEWSAR